MIIAGHRQHSAIFPGAGGIGVLEYVAAAIHSRSLAVPHAEYAVMFGAGRQIDLLRSPQRRGGQIFVDAGLEYDLVLAEMLLGFPQGLIQSAQR